ncbi:hypothetical protein [Morganella sp. GD04133]|uniref:hypothetical protein n=1 Tax=Morganella sp. GD04133 TaxID=2975435 RepID=UPI0024498E54|nr:hypothetical protein [Morganella sp. GD04133]MDH0357059.1 hypothetical protein [Morganella sp. GD04133]
MSGHPHADLMAKAAEIAKTDYWWNEHFEIYAGEECGWIEMSLSSSFIREEEYRLKPRFIDINGHQVPEPARVPLEVGDRYWVITLEYGACPHVWTGSDQEIYCWIERGLIHLTEAAAEAHITALLSFTQK